RPLQRAASEVQRRGNGLAQGQPHTADSRLSSRLYRSIPPRRCSPAKPPCAPEANGVEDRAHWLLSEGQRAAQQGEAFPRCRLPPELPQVAIQKGSIAAQ